MAVRAQYGGINDNWLFDDDSDATAVLRFEAFYVNYWRFPINWLVESAA